MLPDTHALADPIQQLPRRRSRRLGIDGIDEPAGKRSERGHGVPHGLRSFR